eukprot:4791236-Ditylum_brightwellii.AAC.1
MKKRGDIKTSNLNLSSLHPIEQTLPPFVTKPLLCQDCSMIMANVHDKHNHHDMIWKCDHLTVKQQRDMIDLFDDYSDLFAGTLGKVPGKPVSLTLKPDAVPFCSCPYTILMAIKKIAHKEVQKLCNAHVLKCGSSSPWGSPCLFQGKKNGGIQFLTNLRKLNESILRNPYPLPNTHDIVWKMQGFTYATCLDLNWGYYHFALDTFAQRLCAIVLPW